MEFDRDAPAWSLTAGQVEDMIYKAVGAVQVQGNEVKSSDYTDEKYAFGLKEIASRLKCSKTTAWKTVHSGKINPAVSRNGNRLIVDIEQAIQLLKIDKKKRRIN